MSVMMWWSAVCGTLLVVGLCSTCAASESDVNVTPTASVTASETASERLESIVSEFWQWRLRSSPPYAAVYGLPVEKGRLEEFTDESFARQKAKAAIFLAEVQTVDRSSLNKQNRTSLDLLKLLLETYIEGYEYRSYGMYNYPSIMEGPLANLQDIISWMKFETEEDYEGLLQMYRAVHSQVEQIKKLMLKAIEKGTTRHGAAMTGVVEALTTEIDRLSTNVSSSKLYGPFVNMTAGMSASTKDGWRRRATEILTTVVRSAWENLKTFIADVYLPQTASDYGVGALPGGQAYYQAALNWHLSLNLSAAQVHQIGLQEVDRIQRLMEKEMSNDGFHGSLRDYIVHLKSDPDNFHRTEDDMMDGFKAIFQSVHRKLPQVLSKLPKAKLRIEKSSKRNTPMGFYVDPSLDDSRPGTFVANVFDPLTKPKFDMVSLSLHEAEPGHHTQAAYVREAQLPMFRKLVEFRKCFAVPFNWPFFSSYVEGWALYAESLGEEMGVYTEPHSLFGRYASEIFRAVRLVVDTGIHAMGWSKERAQEYIANYTTDSAEAIEFEVNRYIAWPGQACAYKIGELKIRELRQRAENVLGPAFSLPDFHDEILELGPVPLSLLETNIDDWIAETSAENLSEISASTSHLYTSSTLSFTIACIYYLEYGSI